MDSERQLLGVQPGVAGHAKPSRRQLGPAADFTFLFSCDDLMSAKTEYGLGSQSPAVSVDVGMDMIRDSLVQHG